ncbi:MAG: ferrous iron transport protein B [Bacteroidetes bacterium]|nr:ferrous iron transport protein B [Bacteroidota bacterium]MBP6402281.1 ferrous iron transport protein B [Bacteroidia bacterium]MBP6648422.1 ferrous iron transport protein B [Bacteroidia bacterium]
MARKLKIALVGNPNSGKSSVFNGLTGLNQKVANFPGVTVDKKMGFATLSDNEGNQIQAEYIDLPGTYSLYPKSPEEKLPFQILCDPSNESHPDLTIVVADGTNLKRNLFLCSQVIDLKIPVILVINMMDLVRYKKIEIDFHRLSLRLGIPVIPMNARTHEGIKELKKAIVQPLHVPDNDFIDVRVFSPVVVDTIRNVVHVNSNYNAFLVANNLDLITAFEIHQWKRDKIQAACKDHFFDSQQMQARETLERYKIITGIMNDCVVTPNTPIQKSISYKIDSLLTHRVWGYFIFLAILFVIFQAIFSWASYPMDLIDSSFQMLSSFIRNNLPKGLINDLIVGGVLAGLNGIVVFVPQIALLFFFIAILEDTGYMARVSFIMDRLLRKFGLNGKSLIPLISSVACAVPAIMSTRTIQNWKERLITIMVTPLMSCSARLPVYTLLIALIIPKDYVYGVNLQGLVLMMLYLIGFVAAVGVAWVMKHFIKTRERSFFVMELPMYRVPRWSSIGLHIVEKVKIFLFDAGKVIITISIILWVLSSFGPSGTFDKIEQKYSSVEYTRILPQEEIERKIQTEKLESSYAGLLGHVIEPIIKPLGFDWKIGIALITSFAAREVFVGTMSTIYSVGDTNSSKHTLKEKMQSEVNPITGGPRYTFAVGLALMLFYAFAMQCMSTVATVYRETKRIRYPLIQIFYMSGMAYLASLIAYQIFKP